MKTTGEEENGGLIEEDDDDVEEAGDVEVGEDTVGTSLNMPEMKSTVFCYQLCSNCLFNSSMTTTVVGDVDAGLCEDKVDGDDGNGDGLAVVTEMGAEITSRCLSCPDGTWVLGEGEGPGEEKFWHLALQNIVGLVLITYVGM